MTINVATIYEAIADQLPDYTAVVHRDRRLSYAQVQDRARRFANAMLDRGITHHTDRGALENWQSGQDHVAIYMFNCPEYLEAMLGCYMARAVPFNVNFRYVGEELRYLFDDARPRVLIYQARFADRVAAVAGAAPGLDILVQVDDGSGTPLLPGALDYEQMLADASPDRTDVDPSADDLFCLYTGGTTGMPKGVLWRQEDVIHVSMGGRYPDGSDIPDVDAFVRRARKRAGLRILPAPPFMHGAGSLSALAGWLAGNTVVLQDNVEHLDPDDLLTVIEREGVNMLLMVGEAYGRPLLKAAEAGDFDLSSMQMLFTSGTVLSPSVKAGLHRLMPGLTILDTLGSSETGPQAQNVSTGKKGEPGRDFRILDRVIVLAEDRSEILSPGHDGLGWMANTGRVPLGYYGDADKTRETFPVINGQRYVVNGDLVKLRLDGSVDLHGRKSFVINSGGEKIFAEEVENAIKHHPDVADVVVTGRASARWGSEVVAIIQLEPEAPPNRDALLAEAGRHVARYKLPKAFLFLDRIQRSPSGKTDGRWAQSVASGAE